MSDEVMNRLLQLIDIESKYEHIYAPIIDMRNFAKNKNYLYDYGNVNYFETKLGGFTILHKYEDCKCSPTNVTYIIYCPYCSKNGEDSVTSTYLYTQYSKIRFYLMHSNHKCKYNKFNIQANLLCDKCYDPI